MQLVSIMLLIVLFFNGCVTKSPEPVIIKVPQKCNPSIPEEPIKKKMECETPVVISWHNPVFIKWAICAQKYTLNWGTEWKEYSEKLRATIDACR